jgi:LL-diaminopimelate aminotransferase
MTTKNPNLSKLFDNYPWFIFQNKLKRKIQEHKLSNPQQEIFMMAAGDTNQPLPSKVVEALVNSATKLGDKSTYTGYGESQGNIQLRETICKNYYQKRGIKLNPDEIFVSDGAQPATHSIQGLFDLNSVIGLQNPMFFTFLNDNILAGRNNIIYLECNEKNAFIPDVPATKVDIMYLCFPNNPTGAVATKDQLKKFVDYAITNNTVIIVDAIYSQFITDPNIPRSIYEIKNATKCAIEICSFSKMSGFTGLRLGWSVVPFDLTIENTVAGELTEMFRILEYTRFLGASNLAQQGGIVALSPECQQEYQKIIDYYMENAKILIKGLETFGLKCFGGKNNPYIWAKGAEGMSSWEIFDELLLKAGIVGVPGNVFGASGEGFIRLSTFVDRENIEKAIKKLLC